MDSSILHLTDFYGIQLLLILLRTLITVPNHAIFFLGENLTCAPVQIEP